ncbi:hypothetical protein M011DRAFT_263708 [Sporormia fimetaria CBS 119925]|uniref:Uncharacterized protein n=1 Tax=Sporormia fimetaria CBS 119925 TaxID=1340428 RepID=A0A6A6UWK0_9PLEO|nr:hypothetical protein M011DRAFT_263708 [Sporormia fimetaria CBS 119925]
MAPSTRCPIAEIDNVLSPYIHTKQETAQIRRALTRHLTSHIKSENQALRHTDLQCPHEKCVITTRTSSLRGSRLRYLQALEARQKARARLQELHTSLEELHENHIEEAAVPNDLAIDHEAARGYVALLRQRRRLAELQVIQASLEKLTSVAPTNDALKDPKSRVKEVLGEQPDIPAERLEQISGQQDNEALIFQLKKEVLEARASMDHAKARKAEAKGKMQGVASLAQQVEALERARDELVVWMEEELAKLNEESGLLEDASPVKKMPQREGQVDLAQIRERIQESYNAYTTARKQLIDAHSAMVYGASKEEEKIGTPTIAQAAPPSTSTPQSTNNVVEILPHLPILTTIGRNERSLLQQSVYLQAQLSAADQQLTESLTRLAEESHLLASGPANPAAWANAAKEAGEATKTFVNEQLGDGRREIERVAAIIERLNLQRKVLASA